MLFELREGGEEEFSEECEKTELLIAVAGSTALNELDHKRLTRHLASCARCESLAGEILLSNEQSRSASRGAPWRHATESVPANDQRSRIFFVLGALAAAAALLLFLTTGEKTRSVSTQPESEELVAAPSASLDAGVVEEVEDQVVEEVEDDVEDEERMEFEVPDPNDMVGASRPAPPMRKPPPSAYEQLMEKAKAAVKATKYREGLALCEDALLEEPGDQQAHLTCVVAACNARDTAKASEHLRGITSATRKAGLKQICMRAGLDLEPDEEQEASGETYSQLMTKAKAAVKDTQYGKGLKLSKQALDLRPGDQMAIVTAAIASCNLKNARSAKKYLKQVKSRTRRMGLDQICKRLNVRTNLPDDSSDDEVDEITALEDETCTIQEKPMRRDITAGISSVRDKVTSCGDDYPSLKGTYKAKIKILPSGRNLVESVTPNDLLGTCVKREVRKAKFVKTCKGIRVTYPFVFRGK
jgi:hypothetical protein